MIDTTSDILRAMRVYGNTIDDRCADIIENEIHNLREINKELLEALEGMVVVAERDGWSQAVSGRQLILWDAKVAIKKARGE